VAPKVNKNDEFSHDRIAIGGIVALRCPAQSFPVPFYRLVIVEILVPYNLSGQLLILLIFPIYKFVEPVGSVAPRVNKKDGFSHDSIRQGRTIAIFCPAQAYPVPFYR